jgi:hypothetical protein
MSEVVFILGAGASAHTGAPLMAGFLDVARDLYAIGRVSTAKEHFERVFKAVSILMALNAKSKLDIVNVEEVFGAFEMAKLLDIPIKDEPAAKLIESLRIVIAKTLEQSARFEVKDGVPLPPGLTQTVKTQLAVR